MLRLAYRHFFAGLFIFLCASEWALWVWAHWVWTGRPAPGGLATHALAVVSIFVLNASIFAPSRRGRPPSRWRRAYIGYCLVCVTLAGVLLATALLALPLSVASWGIGAAIAGNSEAGTGASTFGYWPLYRVLSGAVGSVVLGLFAWGYTGGQRRLDVSEVPISAPPGLSGLRIAHLTDLHIGPDLHGERLRRYVERVNALEPDLIAITGDIVDRPEWIPSSFPILAELRARHGVFAVLGNHDGYGGEHTVTDGLRQHTAITLLQDEAARLQTSGVPLHILGLRDRGLDWARGLRRCATLRSLHDTVPPGEAVLLLSHRPDIFVHASRCGIFLTLSGHTHGGQIALPWRKWNPARLMTPFDKGHYRQGDSHLYVGRGLGVVAQPVRIFASREIAVLTLS